MRKRIRGLLEKIYILLICILFLLIVMTPYVITESLAVGENLLITQQVFQSSVIACLLVFGYIITLLYRREIGRRVREVELLKNDKSTLATRMEEAFRYIGTINVQLEAIRSAFAGLKEYREHGGDLKSSLKFLTHKILAMIRGGFVLVRIVDVEHIKTISEYLAVREGQELGRVEVGNKQLVYGTSDSNFTILKSNQEYSRVCVFCVFHTYTLSEEQQLMIRSLLDELMVLYFIFSSPYYKGRNSVE